MSHNAEAQWACPHTRTSTGNPVRPVKQFQLSPNVTLDGLWRQAATHWLYHSLGVAVLVQVQLVPSRLRLQCLDVGAVVSRH